MASPMLDGRVEPHKKAHFNLHISDRVAASPHGSSQEEFRSVKYNHKPAQTSDYRSTTLTASSATTCTLRLEDQSGAGEQDVFTFTGKKSSTKSYVLVFDAATQQATLEPLSSSYTFNLASRNKQDVSAQYPKIYPRKLKQDSQDKDDDDLFGEAQGDDEGGDPDPDNPYDFRHFLAKDKEKRGDESEYHFASSPDYRTGTGSAVNTPQFGARKPAAAPKPKAAEPAPKKRKAAPPNPMLSKPTKSQATPAVRLERRATDVAPKAKGPPASKIKSKEIVDSSDDSDMDTGGQVASSPPAPPRRSPSPSRREPSDDEDDDAEGESDDEGVLEIEVPDARPSRKGNGALASLGLGQNLGVGYLKSPSNGPISLASATSSAAGSPNPHHFASHQNRTTTQDEIDFGDVVGDPEDEEEDFDDRDVEPVDIGPPARATAGGHERKPSMPGVALDDDEDDLEKMMMEGLARGDSSEESEEE